MPSTREFLEALWAGIPEGFALVRRFDEEGFKDYFFAWPGESEELVDAVRPPRAYVGVGLRAERRQAPVVSVASFWTTVNLVDVPLARAADALKAFPVRPSAGIVVGDALHAFWLLKAPLSGADLDLAWAANRAALPKVRLGGTNAHYDPFLLERGLQAEHYDVGGLVRAPGAETRFVAWRPEARCSVEEFANVLSPRQAAPEFMGGPSAPAQVGPEQTSLIEGDDAHRISDFIRGMWLEGTLMPSFLAGMFVHSGVALDSAKTVLGEAAKSAGGDVEKCLQHVDATYRRASEGKPVSAKGALQELFSKHYAPDEREKAKKKIDRLEKLLPKPKEADPAADFSICKLVKFDSRPARWSVTLKLSDGEQLSALVETTAFHQFLAFQSAVQEQTHVMLMTIRQERWKRMIGDSRSMIEVKETPKEARPEGFIESALEEFFSDAKEKPDLGMLRAFAAYDEEGRFFRYLAFREFLKENGARVDDRVVYEHLKDLGWKNTVKRFGTRPQRLWFRAWDEKGEGAKPPPEEPPPFTEPAEAAELGLFTDPDLADGHH